MPKKPSTESSQINDNSFTAPWLIKSAIFTLLLLASSYALGHTCTLVRDRYLEILMFNPATVDIGIWTLFSFTLLLFSAGLVAVLVRPKWLAMIAFVLSAITAAAGAGFEMSANISALIYLMLAISFNSAVEKHMDNQIRFSVYPLSHSLKILLLTVSVFLSVSFAAGYAADSAKNNFIIPPSITELAKKSAMETAVETAKKEKGITDEQIALGMDELKKQADKTWADVETSLAPIKDYMPMILGVMMFSFAQPIFMLFIAIPMLLLAGIFPLLKLTRVTHLKTETVEISRYSLD